MGHGHAGLRHREGRLQLVLDSEQLAAGRVERDANGMAVIPALNTNPPPTKTPEPPANKVEKAPALSPAQEAQVLYQTGLDLVRAKQLREARTSLEKCVKVDPTFALCHKVLGGVNAKLNEPEKGLYHYKMFLKLAPNDKDADKVRNIIETYEQQAVPHK